ncbi:hypothetical protein [uncultured Psychrobacter sp.]|uniref:hypothetical protein n=1 Tax=uncultured Psychrobacter sp. TaxID=259303 RepID=UPI00345B1C88
MKKVFLILISLVVVGCTTTPVASPLEPVPAIKTVPETILPKQKTSIFYYYVHPVRPAQSAAVVEGNFAWREGCIYLVGKNGFYHTAMFPLYPKGIVKWDEATKTLNLNGRVFKMRNFISTNGQYSDYVPNSPIGIEYEKQGDKKCLTPTVAFIGTFFD